MIRIAVFFILGLTLQNVAAVTVQVEQGVLRGEKKWTITGNKMFNSFKGIPYVAPPIGKQRFKDPQPAPKWTGVRNATEHGSVCPQFDLIKNMFEPGSEDCLFLNVFTPSIKPSTLMPVMVVIHGGKFIWGSGNNDIYGPDFLIDEKDLVVVTFNYRLDNLGFLCLDTAEVPGNAGMKDQVAALRWVQRNIMNFGGDPSKVTIFGESSGAMSCTIHSLSPMSRGLFRKAIAMSGTPVGPFTIEFEPQRRAFALAKRLGLETSNVTELLEFLQSVPASRLVDINRPIIATEEYFVNAFLLFSVPVVEKYFGQERFLVEPLDISVRKGRSVVDILLGYTSQEGSFFINEIENTSLIENSARYPEALVPRNLFYDSSPRIHLKIADLIKQYYTGSKSTSLKTVPQFVSYITDAFIYSVITYAGLLSWFSRNDNIYLYEFTSTSERNIFSQLGGPYGLSGVSHFDDLMYIFHAKYFNLGVNKNGTSYKMIRQMCALLTNFVTYGNPTPDASLGEIWPRYNKYSQKYMKIGEELTLGTNPRQTTVDFYDFVNKCAW